MITIVDYGICNVGSLSNMLKRLGKPSIVSSDPEVVAAAERLILPGVGAFDSGIANLRRSGLDEAVRHAASTSGIPLLGICLGMQLLCTSSEEGRLPGLGLIDAECRRFVRTDAHPRLLVPHMGWNFVQVVREHQLFAGLGQENRFYFVHSYCVSCANDEEVLGLTHYGGSFASSFAQKNVCAVQFHPEKSHRFGMNLLRNFAEM